MRLCAVALAALGSLPTVFGRMKFLNPPAWSDSAERPVRLIGSTLDLQWTSSQQGKKLSVVLYQLNATQAVSFSGQFHYTEGPFEYITRKRVLFSHGIAWTATNGQRLAGDQIGATNFTWIVNTTKDLSVSPLFSIAVWEEQTLDTDSATDVFVISNATAATVSSTATPSSSSSFSTSAASSTVSSTSTSSTDAASTTSSTQPATGASLSTGAAVGVGVGATLAALSLLAGGWYFGRRCALRRQKDPDTGMDEGTPVEYAQPNKYRYPSPPPVELGTGIERVEAPVDDRRHELEVPDGWSRSR